MQSHGTKDILFFDDFSSDRLDRSKWNVAVTGKIVNNEQQAYIDSDETIFIQKNEHQSSGMLVIQPRYHEGYTSPEGDTFDFVSGRINTRGKFQCKGGTIAARIKLPQGSGLWPAFWTLGTQRPWPCCGELDILESVGEPDWISAAVHGPSYSAENALVNQKFFIPPKVSSHWHIYSLDWTQDDLIFTVDDELIYRVTRPMVKFFGPWVFDQEHFIILNFALGGKYPHKINGIQKPYYGLPKETVRAIQNDKIRILVDWVKVTANQYSII